MATPSSVLAIAVVTLAAGCGGDNGQADKQSVNLEAFATPKGNIGCVATDRMVRCDIRGQRWKVKPNPNCPVDWGNGLSVAGGRGRIVCAGDTVMTDGPVLGHGSINKVGPFECETGESDDSLRCENVKTGHGFELSPDAYRVF